VGEGGVTKRNHRTEAEERRSAWIAEEWQRYSDQLAEWAMDRLVNRRDVWSQYTIKNGEVGVVMLPIKERRKAGTEMVTLNKLRRHFAGRAVSHLIGLHSISDHSTAKWFAIDIDMHDENVIDADEIARSNWSAAKGWCMRLRDAGLDPILMDSNGVGGYHIWVLLDREYQLADVFDYADDVRSNWDSYGLTRRPEIFPPKREVDEDDLPYGLRLPGRHHTRKHYTRIWNFDALGENEWLEGGEAIEYMMNADPRPLPKVNRSRSKKETLPVTKKRETVAKRPRVCLDLDGVLARYEGWNGNDHIGAPLPGAIDYEHTLANFAEIVIFTSRCSEDATRESGRVVDAGKMRIKVIDWLERYKIPYADVYVGQGKPRAAAFIDDRAVSCSPQTENGAFERALAQTKTVLGVRRKRSAVK
jgi:hypothetical protein